MLGRRFISPGVVLLLTAAGALVASCKVDLGYLSEGDTAVAGSSASTAGSSGSTSGGSNAEGGVPPDVTDGGAPSAGAPPVGASGAGGVEGNGGAPPDGPPSVTIVTSNGRVVASANDFGIDGEWRKFGADPSLITTNFTDGKVCIAGRVVAGNWGGGVQLVLHNGAAAGPALVYDATARGVAGIQVLIDGPKVPTKIRAKFKSILGNDDYCREVPTAAGTEIRLLTVEATRNCWVAGGAPVDPTQLENFELHMFPDTGQDIVFDFCVKNVVVVPRE